VVELTRGFWLAKHEVTQKQWEALMETTVEDLELLRNRDAATQEQLNSIGGAQPMYLVSWEDSEAFCEKLGRTFRTPGRWEFELPTEAQWEYACRAGTTGPYGGTGVLDEMGWYGGNSGRVTHPVGEKKANAWGFHDMHGNVWEWCKDFYEEYPRGEVVDPLGPRGGANRVTRGGSFLLGGTECRSAFRIGLNPKDRNFSRGFRPSLISDP
jgi:formylglycine-generating enzyme required for sulfatase activity